MIGEILQAVMNECKAFYSDKGGTFILKTDYEPSNLPSYTMPLCLLDLLEAPESGQCIGGLTKMDWLFALNSYNYQPNPTNDEDGGYSANLLNVVDEIRRHFTKGRFLTQGMTDILNNYGFRCTLSGLMPGDALDQDGLVMGYKVVFDSVSFDVETESVIDSTEPLEHVEQIDYPPTV